MGIPIPKTLVIWASPSHINLAIWVRVRVRGDAHITRFLGIGMPRTWGCPYHCDSGKGKDLGKRLVRAKEGRKEKTSSRLRHFLSMVPCASSPVTRVSRSPLCEIGGA